jgi:diguanylate cyclase
MIMAVICLANLTHKRLPHRLGGRHKQLLFGAAAVAAGWLSMQFASSLSNGMSVDMRFFPVIAVPMFVKRVWAPAAIGLSIGLGLFAFVPYDAAAFGLVNMALIGGLASALNAFARRAGWPYSHRMALLVLGITSFHTLFGLLGPGAGGAGIAAAWSLPVSAAFSGLMVYVLRDFQLEHARRTELQEEANRDFLTKLYNVRAFERVFPGMLSRLERERKPLAVAFVDIDFFKKVNDTYGHGTGDMVLRRIAGLLAQMTRWNDFAARYGGEEFIVALPNCTRDEAVLVMERIRTAVEETPVRIGTDTVRLTVSVGIAVFPEISRGRLIEAADEALYAAKRQGRNRVCVYEPEGRSRPD